MKQIQGTVTAIMLSGMLATSLGVSGTAHAGAKGRKNATAVLGAITAHELIKGRTNNAILTGAGTVVAYKKYKDAKKEEDREVRYHGRRERRERDRIFPRD